MNTAAQVDQKIMEWKRLGMSIPEIVTAIAQAALGWPYVFAGRGQLCTPANRRARIREDCPTIVSKCQVLNGIKGSCTGCKWKPGGESTRFFDCRGFTYWVLQQVGIRINGAGATSQWNDATNWKEKGLIKDMPRDKVCCVFRQDGKKMEHTGLYLGNDLIIHCSAGVQTGKVKNFTHYAIPNGMDGEITERKPTIRRGSKGPEVVTCQTELVKLGYNIGSYGVDGDFGKATEKAVKQFQKDHNLVVDGIVGAATWAALDLAAEQGKKETTEQLYTVHLPGLRKQEAEEFILLNPDAYMTEDE